MSRPQYLPFMDGWRFAMGLKPLPISEWIEIDETFAEQVCLKENLLSQCHAEVFASLPGSETAQQETLDVLVEHLLQQFPQHYQQVGDRLHNRITHQTWDRADFRDNPLDLAGRLVQEDLCLMSPGDRGYVLTAASVCFPLRWQLREKLGQPIALIHEHVPDYSSKLERPVDQFFDRLKADHPGYRFNWSIVDTTELFLANATHITPSLSLTADNAGEHLWVRVERQTFRRLPLSDAVLFTIRTYLYSVQQLAEDRQVAKKLAIAIQQIPPAMQAYKNLLPVRSILLHYLQACDPVE